MKAKYGLTSSEAHALLLEHGFNELPSGKKKSVWWLAFGIVREPMVALLLGGASVYFFIGSPHDSILLLSSVLVIVLIALYQERRSTRALEALRDLSSPRALVVRDGQEQRISAREIVPGDLLLVKEGDRIAADCRVLESMNLEVDESLLTGESHPVAKKPDSDSLFSSTLVTSGHGKAIVIATGMQTEVGKIGKSLELDDDSKTRLQVEIYQLVRRFGALALFFSFTVVLAFGFTKGDWPQGILAGIAAAMSLLPEEFPVILTIFMALGAWRLSTRRVLVRQSAATENLGGVTVLCVDKTGTLTQNQMTLHQLQTLESSFIFQSQEALRLSPDLHLLLETAVLASQKEPFDPMEKALRRACPETSDVGSLAKEYPLTPRLFAITRVWGREGEPYSVTMKGAPEAVVALCRMDPKTAASVRGKIHEMSNQGQRVLGVAKATWSGKALPIEQEEFSFQFLGLLGFIDPLRPQVVESVQECRDAGIRVMMITGDHIGTACKVAADIGLQSPQKALVGADLEKMSEIELKQQVREVSVFARMVPAQKLRIVNALKANGEVVGMTGDGVNDAPSLKWADVGIAMGGRGTDVAREAADLVILDDDFKSIVAAIRLGRRIFGNIRHAMSFIFAVHFPIAALTITPVLLGMPLILFPAHIVFMELIIDPACTLVFEAEEEDPRTMKRPPRDLNRPLFSYRDIFYSSLQGIVVFAVVFMLFIFSLKQGHSEAQGRTLAFITFVLANIGLIAANESVLSFLKNSYFWLVFGLALLSLVAVISFSPLRTIFGLVIPSGGHVAMAVAAALVATATSFGFRKFGAFRRQQLTVKGDFDVF